MTENERFAWLQLAFTPYIGAESFLVLLQQFGSAQAALNAPADKIAALVRHKQAAESWRNADKRALAQRSAEAALQWEMQDGCRLLLLQDDDFPAVLRSCIRRLWISSTVCRFTVRHSCVSTANTSARFCPK